MGEKIHNWYERNIRIWMAERKQLLDFWKIAKHKQYDNWNVKLWVHRIIDRIHDWCRDKLLNILRKISDWAHKKFDEIWEKAYGNNGTYDERYGSIESEDI